MPWELWRQNFIQTASEQLAGESHERLVPDSYRPVFEPVKLRRPVHRELPATFLTLTQDKTMPPGFRRRTADHRGRPLSCPHWAVRSAGAGSASGRDSVASAAMHYGCASPGLPSGAGQAPC